MLLVGISFSVSYDHDAVDVCWRIEPGVPPVINIMDPSMKNVSKRRLSLDVVYIAAVAVKSRPMMFPL